MKDLRDLKDLTILDVQPISDETNSAVRWRQQALWNDYTTLEATQGQSLSQFPTDATRFWWHLYGS